MKEKEKSSIDSIIETLKKLDLYNFSIKAVCEESKELHRKEIIEANMSVRREYSPYLTSEIINKSKQYYTEKYGQ